MASLQKRVRYKGRSAWLIQFILNRQRRSVFLSSKYTKELALDVKNVIEKLVCSIETDTPLDRRTFAWLSSATDDLKKRLTSAGLINIREKKTIGEIIELYLSCMKSQFNSNTYRQKSRFFATLIDSLGKDECIEDIPLFRIEQFFNRTNISTATRATHIAFARACFNWALKQGYIETNPINKIKRGSMKNKEKEYYVEMKDFYSILSCSRSDDVRLALLFYRIGGLRLSEALLVRWDDVDFNKKKIKVHSPKTAKAGKASRTIPLFKELAEAITAHKKVGEFLIQLDKKQVYYEAQLALRKSGVKPYPRLIQNLRSSRAIEISREYGIVVENEWLGHTRDVALSHYLHTTQEDFDKATM